MYANNVRVAILSRNTFTPSNASETSNGFALIFVETFKESVSLGQNRILHQKISLGMTHEAGHL